MIPRHVAPKRSSRVKNVNRRRKAKEWKRAYGSKERVAFVASLPCLVDGCTATPCENAHTRGEGASRKAGFALIVPLCHNHHAELHTFGRITFESKHAIDLDYCAGQIERIWQVRTGAADDSSHMASQDEMGEPHTPGDLLDEYDRPTGAER